MTIDTRISFSSNETPTALALLYLQQTDLTGKSPSEIALIYQSAFEEISDTLDRINSAKTSEGLAEYFKTRGINQ